MGYITDLPDFDLDMARHILFKHTMGLSYSQNFLGIQIQLDTDLLEEIYGNFPALNFKVNLCVEKLVI